MFGAYTQGDWRYSPFVQESSSPIHRGENIMKEAPKKLAYSKKELSAATSLSVRKIDYMIAQGRLRAVRVDGRTIIPACEVERLVGGVANV
jgi:hypothetical protein